MRNAHSALALLTSGSEQSIDAVAQRMDLDRVEVSRILPLAFLAPDITEAILSGHQPDHLTATVLSRVSHLPHRWSDQRRLLDFRDPR